MIVRNTITGETREWKGVSMRTLEVCIMDGVDRCVGPCRCAVEIDGTCSNGWKSRCMELGFC